MKPYLIPILFISCLLLAACSVVPLKTLYELSRIDMMTVDPTHIRAAVRMPNAIRPRSDGARLSMSYQLAGKAQAQELFILQVITKTSELAALRHEQRKGDTIYLYRINPNDLSRLKLFRNRIQTLEKAGQDVSGSMSVNFSACSENEEVLNKLLVTNWLKLDAESGYLATAVDYDLRDELKKSMKGQPALLLPCV